MILASKSQIRKVLLENAGLKISVQESLIDEREVEKNLSSKNLAKGLAIAKAKSIETSDLVLGADQILTCEGKTLHKAKNLTELKEKLSFLQGKTHTLTAAAALVKNKKILWSGSEKANLTMHPLSDQDIDAYLEKFGQKVLKTVGGYHFEEEGITLFQKFTGSYHAILGLPLLSLLNALKKQVKILED